MTMTIKGPYKEDSNFVYVYADKRIYTIAKNTGEWAYLEVGRAAYIGGILTQEYFDELASACSKEGVFDLSE